MNGIAVRIKNTQEISGYIDIGAKYVGGGYGELLRKSPVTIDTDTECIGA